jgi:hypothetical protein
MADVTKLSELAMLDQIRSLLAISAASMAERT